MFLWKNEIFKLQILLHYQSKKWIKFALFLMFSIFCVICQLLRWHNGLYVGLEWWRLFVQPRPGQTTDYKISTCCFSSEHASSTKIRLRVRIICHSGLVSVSLHYCDILQSSSNTTLTSQVKMLRHINGLFIVPILSKT